MTVEPEFKSSACMEIADLAIGEHAARAGVPTSTIRYYERRGLLPADERRSGQRRYTDQSLRRLVFIGMLQDAGLSLDDIAGVLGADHVREWKEIAAARLVVLEQEIEQARARPRLPPGRAHVPVRPPCATDCRVMGTEIDRRLAEAEAREWPARPETSRGPAGTVAVGEATDPSPFDWSLR